MNLSEAARAELKSILERDYGQLVTEEELDSFGSLLLNLMAASIKTRARLRRLGVELDPSCIKKEPNTKQQELPFTD